MYYKTDCQPVGSTQGVYSEHLSTFIFFYGVELIAGRDNILAKENAGPKNGPPNLHTLPYELWDVGNTVGAVNDPIKCVTQCQSFGFTAAGLEYGQQCCKYHSSPSRASLLISRLW